jgi:hypothetical protein
LNKAFFYVNVKRFHAVSHRCCRILYWKDSPGCVILYIEIDGEVECV